MENAFYSGQLVVCINTESRHQCALKLGEVYTVKNKYRCPCGSDQLILEESQYQYMIRMICQCGYTAYRPQSYYQWRFRPYVVS